MHDRFFSPLVSLWMHTTNDTKIAAVGAIYGVYKYVLIFSEMCRE